MFVFVYFVIGLMRIVVFSVSGLFIFRNVRRDCGGGFWKKFIYLSLSFWVVNMVVVFIVRIFLIFFVIGGRIVFKIKLLVRGG